MNHTDFSISSINDTSAACHPILLRMGYTNYRGLCDDFPSSRVLAGLTLGLYTALAIASLIGQFYKQWKLKTNRIGYREVNYISIARNPALMVLGTITSYVFVLVQLLRVVISRKIFPCFLFTFTYWMAVPGLAAIIIGRCVRLVALTWMNQLKVKIGKRKLLTQSLELSESSSFLLDEEGQRMSGSNVELQSMSGFSISNSLSSLVRTEEDNNNEMGRSEESLKETRSETPRNPTKEVEIQDSKKRKSENSEEIFRLSSSKYDKQKLRMYRFITSSKFILILFAVIYGLHLIIYFSVGVADYFNVQSGSLDRLQNKKSSFVVGTHILSEQGCGNGTYNLVVMATYFGAYLLVLIGFVVIAMLMKNDVWKIKWELSLICVGWLLSTFTYAIPSFFSDITTLVDYFFPWQLFLIFGCIWDTFVAHFLPVFVYQRNRHSSKSRDSQSSGGNSNHIKKCLLSKKWNGKFMIYNEKSYCPEDVMAWNAIEQFKMVKSNKKRTELFGTIVRTYILIGSPLELNIARSVNGIPAIIEKYQSINETNVESISISTSIFNEVQQVCEHNMIDSFLRFHSEYRNELEQDLGIKFDE